MEPYNGNIISEQPQVGETLACSDDGNPELAEKTTSFRASVETLRAAAKDNISKLKRKSSAQTVLITGYESSRCDAKPFPSVSKAECVGSIPTRPAN